MTCAESGCVWVFSSCRYLVSDCSTITTQQTCESSGIGWVQSGIIGGDVYCKWQNGACIQEYDDSEEPIMPPI